MFTQEPIIALATPAGTGAIAVIRLSGPKVWEIVDKKFQPRGRKKLLEQDSHTVHLGNLMKGEQVVDEVLVTLFRGPNSYTGEDVVEISCHGSTYIQQQILSLFLDNDCRIAKPGEFTLRAFLNGKKDLGQAEAVADLIASDSQTSHQAALRQMRSGYSQDISKLRTELLDFVSLMELELDFAEEDVAFANRDTFKELLKKIRKTSERLIESFALGNALKEGIPIAIVGKPNVGKSTLLNSLLNDNRALVSSVAGTTRDTVEEILMIKGVKFRVIDTAGLRDTTDKVESMGIERTYKKITDAELVLYLVDANELSNRPTEELNSFGKEKKVIYLANKIDTLDSDLLVKMKNDHSAFHFITAKNGKGLENLKETMFSMVIGDRSLRPENLMTNSRHLASLKGVVAGLDAIDQGMESELPTDLLAIDIHSVLDHLGEITGEVTNDEILGNIFSKFCIGK